MDHQTENETRANQQSGFSLIEVTMALAFVAFGSLVLLATMGVAGNSDEASRKRAIANKAGNGIVQHIVADLQDNDFQDFMTKWQDPANQTFEVDGLENPDIPDAKARATVAINDADPQRIQVSVQVTWLDRGRTESTTIPYTVTELLK